PTVHSDDGDRPFQPTWLLVRKHLVAGSVRVGSLRHPVNQILDPAGVPLFRPNAAPHPAYAGPVVAVGPAVRRSLDRTMLVPVLVELAMAVSATAVAWMR